MANKTFNTRVKNKRDTAANWEAVATTFQPLDGELIIVDTAAGKTRFKVGRYDTAKGRLLYYNEIPFTDEYLYNDLNESQGKIYDKLKGIDDKSIIEMTLESVFDNTKFVNYRIGLWQFGKTGFYKLNIPKRGTTATQLFLYAQKIKEDGTTPEDPFSQDNLLRISPLTGDEQVESVFVQVDYTDTDTLTVYKVQFLNVITFPGTININTYNKTTQKWDFTSVTESSAKWANNATQVSNALTLTKGDTTTKFDGSTAQTVEIPTKTSELTNDSFVSYTEQALTKDQQNQAKTNLGIDILTGNTTTVTPTQVKEAILAGRPIAITYVDNTYGNLTFTSFGYSLENNVVVANLVAIANGQYILADLTGIINTKGWGLQTTELGTSTDIANNYVKYSESQTLTDEQKATARTNIGAISSSEVSSNYLSLDDTQVLTEIQQDNLKDKLGYINNLKVLSNWIEATELLKKKSGHVLVIQDDAHSDGDNIPNIAGDAYPLLLIPARVRSTTQTFHGIDAYGNNYSCSFLYPSYKFNVTKYSMDQQIMKADPTEDMQIATKKYVDSAVGSTKFDIVLTLDTSKNKYVPTQTWDEIKAALEKSTDVKDYNLIVDGVYWSIERFVPDIASSIPGLYLQARNTYNYKTTTNPNNDEIVTLYKVTTIDYEIGQNINKVTSTDGAVTPYVENYVNIRKDDTGAFSCFPIHAIEYLFERNLNTIPTLLYDTVYSLDGIEMTNNSISVAYFSAVSNSIYRRFKITKSTNDAADTVTIDKEIILLDKSDVLTKTNETAFTPTADYQPATKKYVDDSHVQSDWNQNDETTKDYIKNRICYTKDATEITVLNSILPFTDMSSSDLTVFNYQDTSSNIKFNEGTTYTVNFDTTSYTCIAFTDDRLSNAVILGNLGIAGMSSATNEPFAIITDNKGDNGLQIVTNLTGTSHNVKIAESHTEIVKLDKKYIPDDIFTNIESIDNKVEDFINNAQFLAKTDSVGTGSFSFNRETGSTVGEKSATFGQNNVASGKYAFAEGSINKATNFASHAEGNSTTASGNASHAEGLSTKATGATSHSEGSDTVASGDYSHAEGEGTTAEGKWSHTEGKSTNTKGWASHAEGSETVAQGICSHAEGRFTVALGENQHVEGILNIEDTTSLHIVGNGTYTESSGQKTKSNAHTLDKLGNAWFAGDVYVGSTSGTNKDDGSKKLATEEYVDGQMTTINNQLGGLTGAMHFIGKAAVDITDGSTTDPQIANYTTKEKGDVILGKDDHKEFVWNGAIWEELGDEGSYALKTTTINGKALSYNITLTASDVGAASASTIETMQAAIDSKPSAADAVYTATAESTDGVAYTAIVSGIDSLTVGASFIMIPNKASTSKAPTLNVNGLGAKPIRRRLSSLTTSLQQGYSTNWIALNKPFTVVYDGTAWVIEGLTKTDGADVYGAVAQATADAKGNNIADTYATIAMLQSLLPKVTTITLTSNWVGDASPYYQDIALSCVTETSIVDLQPTPEQLNSWQDDGLAFTTLSGNGTVRVYVAGGKPSSAISVQVRVQEVTVI